MKTGIPILLALLLGVCGGLRAQNVLTNGDFETNIAGWTNFWGSNGSWSQERHHAGAGSAQVTHAKEMSSGILQPAADLEIGAVYQARVYAFRTTATVTALISMHTASQPFLNSSSGEKMQQTSAWELLTADLATRPNGVLWVHLLVAGTGTVWFDDASLVLLKTRAQRKAELLPVLDGDATSVEKAKACIGLGEVAFGDGDLPAADRYCRQVLTLVPQDKNLCWNALCDLADLCRRCKEYPRVTAARRTIADSYSTVDTVENAQDLTALAEALGEEADHLAPDYPGAIDRLNEALAIYTRISALYKKLDANANKAAIDTIDDRIVVTRYDIDEYRRLARGKPLKATH